MKMKKLTAMLLSLTISAGAIMTGCGAPAVSGGGDQSAAGSSTGSTADGGTDARTPVAESGTVLRMACGYNSDKTGMSFTADLAGEGITLADGKTYNSGDLKPTWQEIEETLDIKI